MNRPKRRRQIMEPFFPKWTAYLDRPRTVQYSFEAIERFRSLRGIDIAEAMARLNGLPFDALQREFADLIWVGLSAADRVELPRGQVAQFLTLQNMIRMGRECARLSTEAAQPKCN